MKVQIDDKIAEFCYKIIREPLLYFSESDLQQLLTEELRKIPLFKKLYSTDVNRGPGSETKYETSLLHREYAGGNKRRIDIVIFNDKEVENIDNPNLEIGNSYANIDYGFELGTEKTSDTLEHLYRDIDKLIECRKNGYIIHFFKDNTVASTGTKRREKTDNKIKDSFKKVFEEKMHCYIPYLENKNKIKIIAISLKVYRPNEKIIGKCQIYSQYSRNFEEINISSRKNILQRIKNNLK